MIQIVRIRDDKVLRYLQAQIINEYPLKAEWKIWVNRLKFNI